VGYGNVPDNAYTQGRQELNASAGACRAGPPRVHSHTALIYAACCEQDPTNGRRPPAEPGTTPLHPCSFPGSRRSRTPYERTPHAGTDLART
jgi:hypothetical protein